MTDHDCACLVCRTKLIAAVLSPCADCQTFVCPVCGTHGKVVPFGEWAVPLSAVASVRASVWGRPN